MRGRNHDRVGSVGWKFKSERWPSGLRHLTANETGDKTPRGFESLSLRINKELRNWLRNSFFKKRTQGEMVSLAPAFVRLPMASVVVHLSLAG